jgi:hypothetical protein
VLRVRWQRDKSVAAAFVAGLHAVLLYAAFTAGWTARQQSAVIDYINLPPLSPPAPPRDVSIDLFQRLTLPPTNTPSYAITVPALPAPGVFAPVLQPGQSDSALLAAIGRSTACAYASYDAVTDKEDCAARLASHGPAGPFALTGQELRLNAHFTTALAARRSPPLIPCMSGGISLGMLFCLVDGMENGFQLGAGGVPTYADLESDEYGQSGRLKF